MKEIKNLSESIYSRLKNLARERGRPVQEIFNYYVMERFLYRLSNSEYGNFFYLKGGLMLMIWDPIQYRSTVDIDLLARTSNSIQNLNKIIREVCSQGENIDGVDFLVDSLKLKKTQSEAEYEGIHASFSAQLYKAKLMVRIDFGFSDKIFPAPATIKYPTFLDLPAPKIKGYTPQTSIAEKLETIVRRGFVNTRMKDFYDIWNLIQQHKFDHDQLYKIIQQVLQNRGTEITEKPKAFTEEFYTDTAKNDKWSAFLKDINLKPIPLREVITDLNNFFEKLNLIKK